MPRTVADFECVKVVYCMVECGHLAGAHRSPRWLVCGGSGMSHVPALPAACCSCESVGGVAFAAAAGRLSA